MPAWPKPFFSLGATILTIRTAQKLRRKKTAIREQKRMFRALTKQLAATSFWKSHGVTAGMTYEQFKSRVTPRTYEDLAPAVDRMKRGEADVLWPGTCAFYEVSSGTTAGRTKYLPVTNAMLAHFRKAGLDSLLYYTARTGHAAVFRGRHLFLGGS